MKSKITIIGGGYVGLAYSAFLAKNHEITIFDIDEDKVSDINSGKIPSKEENIISNFKKHKSNIKAENKLSFDFDLALICLPTNYDYQNNQFNTKGIEQVIDEIHRNSKDRIILVKSTVPVGFTSSLIKNYSEKILFSPEFLREGSSYNDVKNPSRIILGGCTKASKTALKILKYKVNTNCETIICNSSEAESIKLFSNTFLAMRIAFFNELDSFCLDRGFDTKKIIDGVSLDKRIMHGYNNPSFGYGGYCLPKDTKQLLSNYTEVPQNLIESIVKANSTRKIYLANYIKKLNPSVIGVYKLAMKKGSDNFRESSVIGIIEILNKMKLEVQVYEPSILDQQTNEFKLVNNLEKFKISSDLIITNRMSSELDSVKHKVFTRDIFNTDI